MLTIHINQRFFISIICLAFAIHSNLISASPETATPFSVCFNDKECALADPSGNILTNAHFEEIESFKGEYAVAIQNNLYGVIDRNGRWKIKPAYDYLSLELESNSIFVLAKFKNKYGYLDNNGSWAIKPSFVATRAFENGYAAVMQDGYWGIINEKGKWVIKPSFVELQTVEFHSQRYLAKKDNLWGVIDQSEKWIVNPEFDSIGQSKLGHFRGWDKSKDITKLFDINGKEIFLNRNRDFYNRDFSCESITTNGVKSFGLMDIKGQWLVKPQFQDAGCYQDETSKDTGTHNYSDLIPVKLDTKWGMIDRVGNWVIKPQYDHSFHFSRYGFAEICLNDLWGLIDTQGKWIIEPKYRNVSYDQENQHVIVNLEGKRGVIKTDGSWLIPAQFNNIETVGNHLIKAGILDGPTIIFNESGKTIIKTYRDCGRTKTIKADGTILAKTKTISEALLQKCTLESNSKFGWDIISMHNSKSGNKEVHIKCNNSNSLVPNIIIQDRHGFSSICRSCSSPTLETTAYRTCYLKANRNDAWEWWE